MARGGAQRGPCEHLLLALLTLWPKLCACWPVLPHTCSMLDHVLSHRDGIPISLAVLHAAVSAPAAATAWCPPLLLSLPLPGPSHRQCLTLSCSRSPHTHTLAGRHPRGPSHPAAQHPHARADIHGATHSSPSAAAAATARTAPFSLACRRPSARPPAPLPCCSPICEAGRAGERRRWRRGAGAAASGTAAALVRRCVRKGAHHGRVSE